MSILQQMQKFIISIALVITGILSANAQTVWGVRAGLSVPTVTGNERMTGKFGVEAGPVMYYLFSNKLYLNPAVMFSIKPFSLEEDKLSLYCAEIPVYLGFRIPLGSIDTYFQAGPYASIKLGESKETSIKTFHAGLAAMYVINIKRFKIEAGYKYGLTDFISDKDIKARLSSLFLGVNYVF
jgi:hypothetical protein